MTGGQAQSFFWNATGTALCATLVWHGSVVLDLVIYNGSGTVTYAEVSPGTSPETLRITTVPGQPYKVKAKPETSSGTSTFTLTVNA